MQYRPFSKPGNKHQYVHIESNHPSTITRRIPQSIESRLSNISSTEEIFNNNKLEYQTALAAAGHKVELQYQQPSRNEEEHSNSKRRKRNITWFNPPYSKHVQTKIGKTFLDLVDKHFPKAHDLHKICNRNTIKISYSCTKNMDRVINAHNSKIKYKQQSYEEKCNCRNKQDCPLPEKCTSNNLIYEAKVATTHETKYYIGLTSTTFKSRYNNHKASFTDNRKKNNTELSKYIWKLKEDGTSYTITWKILKHARPYSPKTNRCNLCLWEKFYIITANKDDILNSRTELISTCKHRRKFLLSEYG